MKELLYKLESLKPEHADYSALIEQIMVTLHPHNDDEEIKDLPLLESVIGERASKEAAVSFKKTKKIVPTRCVSRLSRRPLWLHIDLMANRTLQSASLHTEQAAL